MERKHRAAQTAIATCVNLTRGGIVETPSSTIEHIELNDWVKLLTAMEYGRASYRNLTDGPVVFVERTD